MQKIVPHLWFDKEAKEAAAFYSSLFENSEILSSNIIKNPPPYDDAEIVTFQLAGQKFVSISAGPYFKFNPSISLMVTCSTSIEVEKLWKSLSEGGIELMPLGEYPFSKKYAWVQDRFGLSWQLMFDENRQDDQKITCNFLFSDNSCGKAEEAVRYYTEVFENSEIGLINKYVQGEAQSSKAKVNFASFILDGIKLSAMDNGYDVDYNFNEAFSLIVNCKDQYEIDYFWDKLSADPEAEQCGWCKDQFGVSWQILPSTWESIQFDGTKEQIQRVSEAIMSMKKLDLDKLEKVKFGKQ